jgi:hypothetical protein
MNMNKAQVIEAANATFANWRDPLHEDEEGRLKGTLQGKESALVDLTVGCRDEPPRILAGALLVFRIPSERLDATSRFLERLNSKARLGEFHLMRDIRMAVLLLALDVPDGASVEELLIGSIGFLFTTADRWTPKVAEFAMSNEDPAIAAEKALAPAKPHQLEWPEVGESRPEFN